MALTPIVHYTRSAMVATFIPSPTHSVDLTDTDETVVMHSSAG